MTTATIEDRAADAERALGAFREACDTANEATETLSNLAHGRAHEKTEAIKRLVQQENPATPGKMYSASQAADFAQLDPAYAKYKQLVADAELAKQEAEDEKLAAEMELRLRLNLVKAESGMI